MNPGYIVVEGPIGVGKTSLAKRLAEGFDSDLLLEQAEDNPFLEKFYADKRRSALPTQLYFLFQRARQIQGLRQADMFSTGRVADFMLEKDRLFARITLDDDEFRLYEQVYGQLTLDAPQPDLVIYLQAPIEVLRRRISKRGIAHEQYIDDDYLEKVANAYTGFFHRYDQAPLLIVNASELDWVSNTKDFDMLVEQIATIRSGRHFFNPAPLMI